jgi:hypothetical protein
LAGESGCRLSDQDIGEPDELKGSRPVRWGAVAKVLSKHW